MKDEPTNDDEKHLQITLDPGLATAIRRRAEPAGRADDLEGFALDLLASALVARGWFYGVVLLVQDDQGPDWEWRAMAWDADDAHVVDGALVLTDAAGRTTMTVAPGRWKEATKRIEADRGAFEYKPVPDETAKAFKTAARVQQGWPPLTSSS